MNPEPRLLTPDTASGASQFQGRISMMEQRKLQLGPGKYSGNKGIDAIYFDVDNPSQLTILESKWRTNVTLGPGRNAETFLNRGIKNTGRTGPRYHKQMSPKWIDEVIDELARSCSAHARKIGDLLDQYGYADRYINVMNKRGQTILQVMQ